MIVYIRTKGQGEVLSAYLSSWGRGTRQRIREITYQDLFRASRLPRATYIFADLERLAVTDRERLAEIRNTLAEAWPDCRLLNHPLKARRRYSLLRQLYKQGINGFDVYRLEEERRPSRYPVFLRRENSHSKPLSGMLNTAEELAAAERAMEGCFARDDILITEFLNAPDEKGRFWKFSSFIIGDRIVPGHIFVDHDWCVKVPKLIDDEIVEAEHDFVRGNPHEDVLRNVADTAGIEYGRVDYGVVGGKPQIYEINTHPQIMGGNDGHFERRRTAREASANAIESAFADVDSTSGETTVMARAPRRRKSLRERYREYRVRRILSV